MSSVTYDLIKSWANRSGNVNSLQEVLDWIEERNKKLEVNIKKVDFSYNGFWFYDEETGYIRNQNGSFFQLAGYQEIEDDHIVAEQPIILQNEIGYLGILCKKIDGVLNFLMQAKVEPGNINVIQLSPTLQATRSNFMRKHGGKTPDYLEYFAEAKEENILVDQIQSEQSSRFYKKRNRNMIVMTEEDIEVFPSHKWMTLGQIKECMKIDNLVNMDTRTVLSCLQFEVDSLMPEENDEIKGLLKPDLFMSMFESIDRIGIKKVFHRLNEKKMYISTCPRMVPLKSLKSWRLKKDEIVCSRPYDFKVVYCYIEIDGREVKYWEQPLVEALGQSVFGLFTTVVDGKRKYLTRIRHEMGCFDVAEIGPTIQLEPTNTRNLLNEVESLFLEKMDKKKDVSIDVILSEEGGRFYHEENRNVFIEINSEEINDLHIDSDYIWLDYASICELIHYNNYVNIQLRNLMALIDL